jgi:nucleoside-diphosphate-sugar epimerase
MSHVVPDLVQKIIKGQDPLHVLGDGTQVRCYTYGGDLAEGIISSLNHPLALNEDFNLSTKRSTTVLQLAEIIWHKIKGSNAEFRYISDPGFEHDVKNRIPDVSKAQKLLGFQASTSLEQTLDEVIPWVRTAATKNLI